MKILFVLENTIKSLEGGTEVSSFHLANLLRRNKLEVEEWAPYSKRMPMYFYTGIFSQIGIFLLLLWKCVKNRPQILHIQGKYLLPPAVLLGKRFNIPTVATIRDYIVICPVGLCLFDSSYKGLTLRRQGETLLDFIKKEIPLFLSKYHSTDNVLNKILKYIFLIRGWFVSRWLQYWLKQTDAVISVSEAVKDILSQNNIPSQVIYNSFDTGLLNRLSRLTVNLPDFAWTKPRRAGDSRLTILFVGKPSYGKGHDLFQKLSNMNEFKNYEFRTIGGKTKLGYKETLEEIRKAMVVVVPSRWPEPFGRVALEALVLGTPVIASKCGGLTEIISNGKTGILVESTVEDMADALRLITKKNKNFRDEIKVRKGLLIEKFESIPLKSHINLYSALIAKINS